MRRRQRPVGGVQRQCRRCRSAPQDGIGDGARRAWRGVGHEALQGVRGWSPGDVGVDPIVWAGVPVRDRERDGIGRHTAMFLIERGVDVRDVCPTRTAEQARRRQQGKSDVLDATRIARETLADPSLPTAFKRAGADRGPDPVHEQILLWHKARRSLVKSRTHLLNEADHLLVELPLELREQLPRTSEVRRLLHALQMLDTSGYHDAVTGYGCDSSPTRPDASTPWIVKSASSPASSPRWSWRPGPRSPNCAALPHVAPPSCLSKSATHDASPKAGSLASMARRRCRALRVKAPVNQCGTASTRTATAASTACSTTWLSPSCAVTHAPESSTTTPPARPHQNRSHACPQAPALRRRPPAHDPRSRSHRRGSVNTGLKTGTLT